MACRDDEALPESRSFARVASPATTGSEFGEFGGVERGLPVTRRVIDAKRHVVPGGHRRKVRRFKAAATTSVVSLVGLGLAYGGAALAQNLTFQSQLRPKPAGPSVASKPAPNAQMLVQADEIRYDYNNELVSAVGNVQIYYNGATIEADKIIYDQRTKRLHAEGNARLTEANGNVSYGQILELSDNYRDGFIELAAPRNRRRNPAGSGPGGTHRGQLYGFSERRLYGLRGLSGRSPQAAAVAGQGGTHHP